MHTERAREEEHALGLAKVRILAYGVQQWVVGGRDGEYPLPPPGAPLFICPTVHRPPGGTTPWSVFGSARATPGVNAGTRTRATTATMPTMLMSRCHRDTRLVICHPPDGCCGRCARASRRLPINSHHTFERCACVRRPRQRGLVRRRSRRASSLQSDPPPFMPAYAVRHVSSVARVGARAGYRSDTKTVQFYPNGPAPPQKAPAPRGARGRRLCRGTCSQLGIGLQVVLPTHRWYVMSWTPSNSVVKRPWKWMT